MKANPTEPTRHYALRVPEALYLLLQEAARQEGRSINSQIVWELQRGLKRKTGHNSKEATPR
jgi:hypothetical protein